MKQTNGASSAASSTNEVYVSKQFSRSLDQLPRDQHDHVSEAIDRLAIDALRYSHPVPLAEDVEMRLADAGDHRIIFRYEPAKGLVIVTGLYATDDLFIPAPWMASSSSKTA